MSIKQVRKCLKDSISLRFYHKFSNKVFFISFSIPSLARLKATKK